MIINNYSNIGTYTIPNQCQKSVLQENNGQLSIIESG